MKSYKEKTIKILLILIIVFFCVLFSLCTITYSLTVIERSNFARTGYNLYKMRCALLEYKEKNGEYPKSQNMQELIKTLGLKNCEFATILFYPQIYDFKYAAPNSKSTAPILYWEGKSFLFLFNNKTYKFYLLKNNRIQKKCFKDNKFFGGSL